MKDKIINLLIFCAILVATGAMAALGWIVCGAMSGVSR